MKRLERIRYVAFTPDHNKSQSQWMMNKKNGIKEEKHPIPYDLSDAFYIFTCFFLLRWTSAGHLIAIMYITTFNPWVNISVFLIIKFPKVPGLKR